MQSPHPNLLEQLPPRIVYGSHLHRTLISPSIRSDEKKLAQLHAITDLQDRAAAMGNLLYPVCKRTKASDRYVSEEFSTTKYYYLRRNFPKGLFTPENAFDPTMPHSADGRIWFFNIRAKPHITGIERAVYRA